MPNSNITIHDCKDLAALMNTHERRLNETDIWKEKHSGELRIVEQAQRQISETMLQKTQEVVMKLDTIVSTQHAMQLENATLVERIRSSEKHTVSSKADTKWVVQIMMALPQLFTALAIIFAALSLTPQ